MFIIWMILGVLAGILMIKYNEKIGSMIGTIGFAERYIGTGGTYTFLKLLGIFIIIFSIMYPLGGCDNLISKIDLAKGL